MSASGKYGVVNFALSEQEREIVEQFKTVYHITNTTSAMRAIIKDSQAFLDAMLQQHITDRIFQLREELHDLEKMQKKEK